MNKQMLLVALATCLAACGGGGPGSSGNSTGSSSTSLPDPNGSWKVTAHVTTCFDATGSAVLAVVGGQFNGTVFSYTSNGCSQTVSVQGTIEKGNASLHVSGNAFLSGGCCNGGNGFDGFLDKGATTGSVASAWGDLKFEKQ